MTLFKKTRDLVVGDQVAEDVYKGNMLLVKAGVSIDAKIKQRLEKWQIASVPIAAEIPSDEEEPQPHDENVNLSQFYYELLHEVVNETRYGYALHCEKSIRWLEAVFVSSVSDRFVYEQLMRLKTWDADSFYHTFDVFLLGSLLYKKLGKTYNEILLLAKGCLLHDIGKLYVPQAILQKEGSLTPYEYEVVKEHPVRGYEIIKTAEQSDIVRALVKSHHEKLDGTGYPEGLKSRDIAPEVRVLTIVDMYSALTMMRCYRSAFEVAHALKLLFDDRQKIDHRYLVEFIDMIGIYPPHTIVELSDGTRAEVLHIYERIPYMPIVKRLDNLQTIELPSNLSLKVSRFVFK